MTFKLSPRMIRLRAKLHVAPALALLALPAVAVAGGRLGEPGSVVATPPDMTYYARQGDTLSEISKRFTDKARNWGLLAKRNKIEDDRAIPVGTPILIPLDLLPEDPSEARVLALAGLSSQTPRGGTETVLTLGAVVNEGTQITTGKNGFLTLALPDDSRISIPSNSQVVLAKLRQTKYGHSPRTEIALQQGKVESRVTPLSNNKGRFEVRTPLSIAGVRGTHFRVGMAADAVTNEVLTGAVAVGKHEKPPSLLLAAGKGNLIGKTIVGTALDLLPAPVLEDGYQLQERPTMQFNVEPIAAAKTYRVQIARDAQAQDILAENVYSDHRFKFDGIADGHYFVRITATDANGLEGLPEVQAFTLKARPEPPFTVAPKAKLRADKLDFAWTEAAQARAYHVQVASDAAFGQVLVDQSDLGDVQMHTDQLRHGSYFWRIATIADTNGQADQGPYSAIQQFEYLPPQAAASANDNGGNELSLSWPSEPGQKFLLQIARDAAFQSLYLSRELTQAELRIARPDSGQYFIRVRATDADGYTGVFSATQKINIWPRWVSGDGAPVHSASGAVRAGF